ncbi:hypothetical protein HZC21_01450 [Candidatus Peregrinibacteria bacterium]|nr:hypothetical protein [Candidatus Peregrinibacteria bacterium]
MKKHIDGKSKGQNPKSKKILKWINGFLIFAIIFSLAVEAVLVTRIITTPQAAAQEETPAAPAEEEVPAEDANAIEAEKKCANEIKAFMAGKQIEFGEAINQHFRSGKPTSELIPAAIELYRQYRAQAREKAKVLMNQSATGKKTFTSATAEKPACEKAVEEDFAIMKDLLRQHISQNAYAKKSTRLLDQYKILNSKLGELNFTIAQTYGYFAALSQKLSCYATKCGVCNADVAGARYCSRRTNRIRRQKINKRLSQNR